jgi:LCP family protein required for cell wall assembly
MQERQSGHGRRAAHDGNAGRGRRAASHGRPSRGRARRTAKIAAWTCVAMVVAVGGAGTYLYEHLMGNINTVSLYTKDRPAPPKPNAQGQTPENILVLGSQTRDGQTGVNLGGASKLGTDLSDTAMLFHLSADRKWAVVVSIPRDLVVARPQCTSRFDPSVVVPGENTPLPDATDNDMFDSAMNLGGPACAVATVEQMTGIYVDHFVELTFNAFQDMTNAVGGVTVCIPPPGINDPDYSGLVLGPGLHVISGAQALEFIRDRHGVGDGTDLGRIQYQQMFVSSLYDKLASNGTLDDPITLYKIAQAVTSNLTVDPGLDSVSSMVSLAASVHDIKSEYIQLITAPYEFDPYNQNRVVPGTGFAQVWTDLRNDEPLPGSSAAEEFGTGASSAAPNASATGVPLSSLSVEIYNGTEISGLAGAAAANLAAEGVHTTVERSGYSGVAATEILYPAGQQIQANALALQVPGAVVQQSTSVSTLTLVVGPNDPANLTATPGATGRNPAAQDSAAENSAAQDSTGAPSSSSASPTASISMESRTGNENICSNLPTPNSFGGSPSD